MSAKTKRRRVHYVLSTHWDREWYEPFQFYRFRLVQLLDRVLDGLEDGRLKGPFQTDGQSIILDDYLEVRPERRDQVERFAREGKLAIGPWYVLPDEFIVSGESHIRNIRLGRQIARDYGTEPSNAGFVCDLFGHISQLPQIFKGFGITAGFVWRGINLDRLRHLIWEGADGTELVCYKYANIGYCDYAFKVRDADKFAVAFDPADKMEKLKKYLDFEASETETDVILIFDGGDHQEWDQKTYGVFAKVLNGAKSDYQVMHSTLDDYLPEMLAQRNRISTRLVGELREPGKTPGKASHQIPGVLSSRLWIKQSNADCQTLLCQWAEPFASFASLMLDAPYPHGFLNVAWKHLLQNHPHDSICGCSIDQVHEDMKYRFSQCRQIGERLTLDATRKIAANIDGKLDEKDLRVVVFNPLPVDHDELTDVVLDIPEEWPTFAEFFNFEAKPAFKVFDVHGKEVPFQRVSQATHRIRQRIRDEKFPQPYWVTEVKVSLPLRIPAMGYTTLLVKPGVQNEPIRYPQDKGLATAHNAMENESLRAAFEANGTITLTDKRNGNVYTDILLFEERADIGDGWFHGVAVNDEIQVTKASAAEIGLIETGPNVTAFKVRLRLRVPAEFHFPSMTRAENRVEMIIDSTVRLRQGTDYLEVETRIYNQADDHRVRVLAPSGAKTDSYYTDTPFDVVKRPIGVRTDNHLYTELEVETKPQQTFTAAHDKKRGLAIVSHGQMETCVCDYENRPIAMTLFRGTRRTVNTNGEPNGQLRGVMNFRYFIKPLGGEPDFPSLFLLGQKLGAGLRTAQVRVPDLEIHRLGGGLAPEGGLIGVEGPAIMTSARHAGGSLEIRLFNPTSKAITGKLRSAARDKALACFESAQLVDLESNPLGQKLNFNKGIVEFKLKPKEIITIQLG